MGDYFIGEIRTFSFAWAPQGWALANGAVMQINQAQALYSLFGITYGGNGTTNFNLPNLNGRTPVSQGRGSTGTQYQIGTVGGVETVTLTTATVPPHTHNVQASTAAGTATSAADAILAANGGDTTTPTPLKPNLYGTAAGNPVVALASQTLSTAGNGAPHPNMQPFTVVNYCIAMAGLYPMRP